jgi:hypothetical protein
MRRREAWDRDVDERARVGELFLVPREEGRRVPVRAEAEEDEVERPRQADLERAERMDLLLRDRRPGEKRLPRQPLVRVGVLRRDDALVAPPDVPGRPVGLELRQALVNGPRCRATGQRDPKRRLSLCALRDPAGAEVG